MKHQFEGEISKKETSRERSYNQVFFYYSMMPGAYLRIKPAKKWESSCLSYVHEMKLEVET